MEQPSNAEMRTFAEECVSKPFIRAALQSRLTAYAPYSKFLVGASLLTKKGNIHLGCNIENAAYGPSLCAERLAISKAVACGERAFIGIAIAGGPEASMDLPYCPPCGICLQVMREFCDPAHFRVVLCKSETQYKIFSLKQLLPLGFGPDFLEAQP